MEQIIRTVIDAKLQTCLKLGLPFVLPEHSTLNEKLNIHNSVALGDSDRPIMKYVAIGNGGHKTETGGDGFGKVIPVPHRPRDTGLYSQLPFVLRQVSNDLTATERMNYRLRRMEVHGGTTYVAYYLKVLDLSTTVPQLELRSVDAGVTTVLPFAPTLSDLNPTRPPITSGTVLTASGDYVAATGKVPFVMSSVDIANLIDVATIIYNDPNYAFISEIALCAGVDKILPGEFGSMTSSYTDCVGCHVTNFISTSYPVNFVSTEIRTNLNIGSVEPLLTIA